MREDILQIQVPARLGWHKRRFESPLNRLVDFGFRERLVLPQKLKLLYEIGAEHRGVVGVDAKFDAVIEERAQHFFKVPAVFDKADFHIGRGAEAQREIFFADAAEECDKILIFLPVYFFEFDAQKWKSFKSTRLEKIRCLIVFCENALLFFGHHPRELV